VQIGLDSSRQPSLPVEEAGQFPHGEAVPDWQLMDADEGTVGEIEKRALDDLPADGIGAVEDHKGDALLSRRFKAVEKSADIGVEAGADILNIENQYIHILEHFQRRLVVLAIEAVDRDAGAGILLMIEQGARLEGAAHPVFRAEEGDQLQVPGLRKKIGSVAPVASDGGVVGDQADPLARKRFKVITDQEIEPGVDLLLLGISAADQGQCCEDHSSFHLLTLSREERGPPESGIHDRTFR